MLKYTIKNIKLLLNEKGILWAMIGCVFMSGIMISFSCGIYYNYTTEYLASNSYALGLGDRLTIREYGAEPEEDPVIVEIVGVLADDPGNRSADVERGNHRRRKGKEYNVHD